MPINTVIWDFNGTLLDDVQVSCDILNGMLLDHGYPPIGGICEYKSIFGFPIEDYYKRAGFDFERHSFEELADVYMGEYKRLSGKCTLQKGAQKVLQALSERGVRQIVLSASPRELLVSQIKDLGISEFFDTVLGLDNIFAKSKIEMGRAWIEQNNMPCKAIMIGDTTHDYDTALAIGAEPVLYAGGHQPFDVLCSTGARVIRELEEILQLNCAAQR
ncbi:MAG: HAD family hydrolase [Oscillospiraceae bacterium]